MSDRMSTQEMLELYDVIGFSYGCCEVRRKADGVRGTLFFEHNPRYYYDFIASGD
jgi:hypothetical protein